MPERVENTLQNHKTRLLGGSHLNVSRDEYVPRQLLSQITGGQNVIVLDSHDVECMPPGWETVDPQALFVPPEPVPHQAPDDDQAPDEEGIPPNDVLSGTILDNHCEEPPEVEESGHQPRVLVFTTLYLLSLLSQVKTGDNFFKTAIYSHF